MRTHLNQKENLRLKAKGCKTKPHATVTQKIARVAVVFSDNVFLMPSLIRLEKKVITQSLPWFIKIFVCAQYGSQITVLG